MSIFVSGIRQAFGEPEEAAFAAARKMCGLGADAGDASVYRVSIDARRGRIHQVYTVVLDGLEDEEAFAAGLQMPSVRYKKIAPFAPAFGKEKLVYRPVVVGLGPAGLFAAHTLARFGYKPLVLERGDEIARRDAAVEKFWSGGALDPDSNIQFGEGGAGAYSDGKLTTRINDPLCDEILRVLVEFGAPREILRQAKPHIGTDVLKKVVRAMREDIISRGGEVRFRTAVTGLRRESGVLTALYTGKNEIGCEQAVLAIGHSARDTFFSLHDAGVYMEPKAFSVGVRIEHLQEDIDRALYGNSAGLPGLPPAEYTLSHRENGRACYSFCMCPGGHVVAAQSEERTVVTNGMSYHARDGRNANAALAVSVDPSDFDNGTPLGGIAFQRRIERAAFEATGGYCAPCQTVGDFLQDRPTGKIGRVQPTYPVGVVSGRVDTCLPEFVTRQLCTGLRVFGRKIRGFDAADALLTAPETRTSSPVRLSRGEDLYSLTTKGLIPCGEGAGYAGGIMSAAVDGVRAACRIMAQYAPME
ncbi:MAG: hypothetical protein KH050_01845 [Clostridiaceae bacterium]|nr:hypothetical protein [Clostridiaceae bacterium]